MAQSKLTFIKIENILLVGLIDSDNPKIIVKPRMVFVNDQKVSLAKFIGNPSSLIVSDVILFSYLNEDKEFEKFYRQETSDIPGLKLVQ